MRSVLAFVMLCLAAAVATAQDEPPTIRVDVKLVNVFSTVVDAAGAPVGGLTREDFQIYEDGAPQNIAVFGRESALPLSIVLSIDTSLSTRKDQKLETQSARRFVRSILRPQDALSLYVFSNDVEELVHFSSDIKSIDRAIGRIRAGSSTSLYDAIYLGAHSLLDREGRKVLVVITDGGDTTSRVSYQEAVRAAQQAEATVYSIIVVPIAASAGRNTGGENALIQLAHDTGGKHYYADSTESLDKVFSQISDELRTQYLLAYYPTKRLSSSEFRRIEVRLKEEAPLPEGIQKPARVRHRSGYYTSKAR